MFNENIQNTRSYRTKCITPNKIIWGNNTNFQTENIGITFLAEKIGTSDGKSIEGCKKPNPDT